MTKAIELSQLGNKLRVNSAGDVAIGASADHQGGILTIGDVNSPSFARAAVAIKSISSDASVGTANLYLEESSGAEGYYINVNVDGGLVFNNSGIETTLILDNANNILVGKTASSGLNAGCEFRPAGFGLFTRSGANPLQVRRLTDDGDLVEFYQDTGLIGSVRVDGTSLAVGMAGATKLKISSTGKVGIGNVDPANALHIKNDSPVIRLESSASSYVGRNTIGQYQSGLYIECDNDNAISNSAIIFNIDGGEELRITSDGKIGINNSDPLYAMHFKNAMGSSPSFIHMEVTGSNIVGGGGGIAFDTSATNSLSNNGLYLATISGVRNSAADGSNDLVFKTSKAGVAGDDGYTHSPKERLRITSDGKIGIGTDAPGALLHLESTAANAAKLRIGFDSPRYYDIFRGSTTNSGYLNFYGSQSTYVGYIFDGVDGEWMRIKSNGNVGIGTDNPAAKLDILGALRFSRTSTYTSNVLLSITHTNSSNYGSLYFDNSNATGDYVFRTTSSNTERLRIASDGTTTVGPQYDRVTIEPGNGTYDTEATTLSVDGRTNDGNLVALKVDRYDSGTSATTKFSVKYDGSIFSTGSVQATGVNLQNSATSSWFQTGTNLATTDYVWAAKNSSSNTWHSGLQTDGDLYLGCNLAGTNNIALNGSNGSGWFSCGLGIGGYAAANTMDKYEEGSYTPKIYAGTGTTEPSYNWRYGQYVRIGEVVHVWGAMGISGSMPTCTQAYIGNLPYNQLFDDNQFFHYVELHGYTWASGYGDSGSSTGLFLQTVNGTGNKVLIVNGSNKNHTTHAMIGSGQRFTFQFSYVVG